MMGEEEEQKIIVDYDENENRAFSWKKLAVFMGPGFLMSIAYLDPGFSLFQLFYNVELSWISFICWMLGQIHNYQFRNSRSVWTLLHNYDIVHDINNHL